MKTRISHLIYCLILISVITLQTYAQDNYIVRRPVFNSLTSASYNIKGVVGEYIDNVKNNWLMKVPDTNPALLDMFAVRDKEPYKKYLPWSGEFAGKYLTGASLILRLTNDPGLRTYTQKFVNRLISLQDTLDGYLGPFKKNERLTGWDSVSKGITWEEWNHGHIIAGLLAWYEETGDTNAFKCACKIGDMMCNKFLHTKMISTTYRSSTEMNQGLIYGMTLLYKKTGAQRYLDLANEIVKEFQLYDRDTLQAGDYVRQALAGKEFYQTPRPRWESLISLLGVGELYYITGNEDYKTTLQNFWWSIDKTDRHNNGGFSSGEGAMGNPYDYGYIETCCTVAWIAMSVETLGMTGNSIIADELEMSTLNQVIGYESPDGLWCTYNTPMDGKRIAGMHSELKFQIRPGSEEINCCSAYAPCGFGYISKWAVMSDSSGLVLNWYGPSSISTTVKGVPVTLTQTTEYPKYGSIKLNVDAQTPETFSLKLRIPYWSKKTGVSINGVPAAGVEAGQYFVINREWKRGDVVSIDLDMSFRYWKGEKQCDGKSSVYRGPLLLVHEEDEDVNSGKNNPTLDADTMDKLASIEDVPASSNAQVLIDINNGVNKVRLQDYGTAGANHKLYKSWLYVHNTSFMPFSHENPGRSWSK